LPKNLYKKLPASIKQNRSQDFDPIKTDTARIISREKSDLLLSLVIISLLNINLLKILTKYYNNSYIKTNLVRFAHNWNAGIME